MSVVDIVSSSSSASGMASYRLTEDGGTRLESLGTGTSGSSHLFDVYFDLSLGGDDDNEDGDDSASDSPIAEPTAGDDESSGEDSPGKEREPGLRIEERDFTTYESWIRLATANYDFDTSGIQHHPLLYGYNHVETVFKFNLEDGLEHKRGESSASREAAGNNLTFPDKPDVVWTSLIPTPNREELLSQYRAVKVHINKMQATLDGTTDPDMQTYYRNQIDKSEEHLATIREQALAAGITDAELTAIDNEAAATAAADPVTPTTISDLGNDDDSNYWSTFLWTLPFSFPNSFLDGRAADSLNGAVVQATLITTLGAVRGGDNTLFGNREAFEDGKVVGIFWGTANLFAIGFHVMPSMLAVSSTGTAGIGGTAALPQLLMVGGGNTGAIATPVAASGVLEIAGLLGLCMFSTGGAGGDPYYPEQDIRIEDGIVYENGVPMNPKVAEAWLKSFQTQHRLTNQSLELARELGDAEAIAAHTAELAEIDQWITALMETIR